MHCSIVGVLSSKSKGEEGRSQREVRADGGSTAAVRRVFAQTDKAPPGS